MIPLKVVVYGLVILVLMGVCLLRMQAVLKRQREELTSGIEDPEALHIYPPSNALRRQSKKIHCN